MRQNKIKMKKKKKKNARYQLKLKSKKKKAVKSARIKNEKTKKMRETYVYRIAHNHFKKNWRYRTKLLKVESVCMYTGVLEKSTRRSNESQIITSPVSDKSDNLNLGFKILEFKFRKFNKNKDDQRLFDDSFNGTLNKFISMLEVKTKVLLYLLFFLRKKDIIA